MSSLQFSSTPPEQVGHYWWIQSPGQTPDILQYFGEELPHVLMFSRDETLPLSELVDFYPEIQFAGPIPVPPT